MKKLNVSFGILTLLIIALLVAGCGSTAQAGGASSTSAKDLVSALGGKAKVSGGTITLTDTITLSGDVEVENTLVVPEGVTLDLTADGARLFLKDGATLTVNGTVNTRGHGEHNNWNGSIYIDKGAVTINGSGTINLKSKGRILSIWSGDGKRKLTLDGVTLIGLKDNIDSLVRVENGSELVLKGGKITGNTTSEGGGVNVEENSTFTMTGGTIMGNNGGGVRLRKSTFIMEGGEISGNSGHGVHIQESSTFTMKNGRITGNTIISTVKDAFGTGAGVEVSSKSSFTMEGGTISGNIVEAHNGGGGGVFVVDSGTFTMKGGSISDNIAKTISGAGGGVRFRAATFTMEGGTISGNTLESSTEGGGGVYAGAGGTFIMKGGTIYGNTDRLPEGVGANYANDAVKNAALQVNETAKWGTGGTYTKGGVSQTGGSNIGSTNDTLIAVPAK